MHTYEAKKFTLPSIEGISDELMKQHIGLYEGYVKNFNAMTALAGDLMKDEKNAPGVAELMRRRSFEFGGMRLHEHYFPQFEGGAKPLSPESPLGTTLSAQYGNPEHCIQEMKYAAMMRGPGWALLYWDAEAKQFLVGFTGEQHMGHFATLPIMLAIDVWEHAYILDHGAAGKGAYLEAFWKNLNWDVVERRFQQLA